MTRRPYVFVVAALSVVAMLAMATGATAGSRTDRATGGGQILISSTGGAGDTIAFTAQGTATAAKGQVQYVDRTGGTGQGQTTYHGDVACLVVDDNIALIAGTWRDGGNFQLYVEDNGEGALEDDDIVVVVPVAEEPGCDEDQTEEEDQTALARGNAQVYDASA